MDKSERDELEAAAQEALGERWCTHPNGTSVWTGEEYDTEGKREQHHVCNAVGPLDLKAIRRMEFIATCNPAAVLELLEFYGLSDTRLERGPEDNDEVCAACGGATTEGHTHAECYVIGKADGALDENLRLATSVSVMLGQEPPGFFDGALEQISQLRADAYFLARTLESRAASGALDIDPLSATERVVLDRVCGK